MNSVRRRRPMSEINVVPYIDVMLVLLIIFMVTVPLIQQGVEIELPEAATEALPEAMQSEPLVVSVDRHGRFFLNRGKRANRPVNEALLAEELGEILSQADAAQDVLPPAVYVRGDHGVAYGRVMEAMVLLQKAGAGKVGLVTQPPTR